MGVSAGVVTFCVWVTLLLEVPVVEGDVSLEVPLASSTATGSAAAAATSPRSSRCAATDDDTYSLE